MFSHLCITINLQSNRTLYTIYYLLHQLFSVVWHAELVSPQWREGLIVNLFKKGDKEVADYCMRGRLALDLKEVA